jgi:hypothetical protein
VGGGGGGGGGGATSLYAPRGHGHGHVLLPRSLGPQALGAGAPPRAPRLTTRLCLPKNEKPLLLEATSY